MPKILITDLKADVSAQLKREDLDRIIGGLNFEKYKTNFAAQGQTNAVDASDYAVWRNRFGAGL